MLLTKRSLSLTIVALLLAVILSHPAAAAGAATEIQSAITSWLSFLCFFLVVVTLSCVSACVAAASSSASPASTTNSPSASKIALAIPAQFLDLLFNAFVKPAFGRGYRPEPMELFGHAFLSTIVNGTDAWLFTEPTSAEMRSFEQEKLRQKLGADEQLFNGDPERSKQFGAENNPTFVSCVDGADINIACGAHEENCDVSLLRAKTWGVCVAARMLSSGPWTYLHLVNITLTGALEIFEPKTYGVSMQLVTDAAQGFLNKVVPLINKHLSGLFAFDVSTLGKNAAGISNSLLELVVSFYMERLAGTLLVVTAKNAGDAVVQGITDALDGVSSGGGNLYQFYAAEPVAADAAAGVASFTLTYLQLLNGTCSPCFGSVSTTCYLLFDLAPFAKPNSTVSVFFGSRTCNATEASRFLHLSERDTIDPADPGGKTLLVRPGQLRDTGRGHVPAFAVEGS